MVLITSVSHLCLIVCPLINELDESTPVLILFITLCISFINCLAFQMPSESPLERLEKQKKLFIREKKNDERRRREKLRKRLKR